MSEAATSYLNLRDDRVVLSMTACTTREICGAAQILGRPLSLSGVIYGASRLQLMCFVPFISGGAACFCNTMVLRVVSVKSGPQIKFGWKRKGSFTWSVLVLTCASYQRAFSGRCVLLCTHTYTKQTT
jgi:hypothetical protein